MIQFFLEQSRLTVCVPRGWAGRDKAWEQYKPEARKMLENAARTRQSGARGVGRFLRQDYIPDKCV